MKFFKKEIIYLNSKQRKKLFKHFAVFASIVWFLSAVPFSVMANFIDNEVARETINLNEEKDVTKVPIKSEIIELRESHSKIFLKEDGLFERATYQEDVHYFENGVWKDIDNSLGLDESTNEYFNKTNRFQIKLPKKIDENKKFKLSYEDYSINWTIDGINRSEISVIQKQKLNGDDLRELLNINQTVNYQNIFDNIDLEYIITGNGLKENIILNQYQENFSVTFNYYVKGLTIVEDDLGNLVLVNENNEVVFRFGQLFMINDNEEISNDITYSVYEVKKGEYKITITPDDSWLKTSSYPVKIDPTMTLNTSSDIRDMYVHQNSPDTYDNYNLYVGDSNYNVYMSFMEFNISQLVSTSNVVNATLQLTKKTDTCSPTCQINLYGIEADYDTITPYNTGGIMEDGRIYYYVDVNHTDSDNSYEFDITKLVQRWLYDGKDYGTIALSPKYDDTGRVTFNPINDTSGVVPLLQITYVNQGGLDSYYTYHEQSNGAGISYVNDYSGNLTFIHSDIVNSSERMGFSINHVYNAFDKTTDIGYGNGWRINLAERVVLDNSTNTYYIIDGDGSERYFESKSCTYFGESASYQCGLAMDGSGDYYVKINSYTMYLKTKGTIVYTYSLSTYGGYLTKIEDKSNYEYINISYTLKNGKYVINKVTDKIGNYAQFIYNSTTYKLEEIEYYKRNDSSVYKKVENVIYSYTGNDLTSIIHKYDYNQDVNFTNETENTFIYNNGNLTNVKNTYSNELKYTYNANNQVIKIEALKVINDVTKNIGVVSIIYDFMKTTYIDMTENKVQYTFDSYGRTINILDDLGNALFYQYYDIYQDDSVNYNYNNKIINVSKPQKTTVNLLYNHSFEKSDDLSVAGGWECSSTCGSSAYISDLEGVYGNRALKLSSTSLTVNQTITLDIGEYTVTGYVKNPYSSSINDGAYIDIGANPGVSNIEINGRALGEGEWIRVNTKFNVTQNDTQVTIKLVNSSVSTAIFDQIQLKQGFIDTRYNLIYNQSFESDFDSWTGSGFSIISNVGSIEDEIYDNVLGDNIVKVIGGDGEKTLTQTIDVNQSFNGLIIGGWAKTKLINHKESLQIIVDFTFADSSTQSYILQFNNDVESWQYMTDHIELDKDTVVTQIEISVVLNADNDAYFDGIQLYIDTYGTKYNVSNDGNMTSTIDASGKETQFEYSGNDLIAINPIGENGEVENQTDITYNSNRQITEIENNSKRTFTYDSYGNVESTRIGGTYIYTTSYVTKNCDEYGHCTFETVVVEHTVNDYFDNTVTYSSYSQYVDQQTNEFNESVDYDFDTVTGLLEVLKDQKDQETSFIYDDLGRLTSVTKGDTENSYIYVDGRLDTITVNGFSYNFVYDDLDRMIEVRVANQTLMEYAYTEENINGTTYYKNQLLEQIYGNGDKIKFEYDDEDRITKIFFNNFLRFEYKYDSSNLLAQLIDNVNGKTYFYNYDSLGRLISISDEDENKVSYSYDSLHGDLNQFTTSIDGQEREINYSTDYLNGVYNKTTYKVNDSDITKEYIYDLEALQRLSGFTINVGTTEIFEETYYYDDSEVVNGYRTYRIDSVKLAKGTTTHKRIYYTYDEIGNITSITEKNSSGTIISSYSYVYDSLNQLIRENIKTANEEVSYTYEYDLYGNIRFKKEYTYTTGTLGTPINITEYVYNSSGWKDQLLEIKLNGDIIASFSYDSIGNPLSDNKYLYEWEGRQLVKLTNQSTGEIIEYRYNDAGYRTYKKVSTDINNYEEYFYYLEGDKVINEKIMHYVNNVLASTDNIYYTYDVDGTLISMNYNGEEYFYVRNLQQDIIALIDISGNIEVEYQYDAWGNIIYQTNNTLAKINPYRYRGYRYDEETKWYYLNSRYYNSEIGRFINADGLIGSTGDLLGHNMFAYCQNNPIMMVDPSGYWPFDEIVDFFSDVYEVVEEVAIDIVNVTPEVIDRVPGVSTSSNLFKYVHYKRNDFSKGIQFPGDPKTAYDMEWKDNVSAKCHQFTAENRDNVKFVSPYGGFHEIIFDVNKEEVTNARDRGTFNFIPSGISGIGHGIIDVFPWIIWGNSEDDTTTVYERIQSLSR